jgi:hypothetical protein
MRMQTQEIQSYTHVTVVKSKPEIQGINIMVLVGKLREIFDGMIDVENRPLSILSSAHCSPLREANFLTPTKSLNFIGSALLVQNSIIAPNHRVRLSIK